MAVADRFLRYVRIDTQSDPGSTSVPSTAKQKDLSTLLRAELEALGAEDVRMDEYGYVFASLPGTVSGPTIGLLAHVDTSFDAPGAGVQPIVHQRYDGGRLALPGDSSQVLDGTVDPALAAVAGHDLITSDGTTLLGSDDKAGVAIIMQLVEDALAGHVASPPLRVCFTIDEEIGKGVDHLSLDDLAADVAYTLDGSGIDRISAETFNAAGATLIIEGVGVHPGYAEGIMVNALRILADFIGHLPAGEAPETTSGRAGYTHPHRVATSSVERAELHLILRDFDEEGLERRKAYLQDLVQRLSERYPGATLALDIADQYKNMRRYIDETDSRVVDFALEAGRRLGLDLELEPIRGGTDGARLSERGLPTPNLFTGGHRFHSRKEWNTVQNLEHSLAYVKEVLQVWAEQGG